MSNERDLMNRCFQDVEGKIPVTESGQPVGLIKESEMGEVKRFNVNNFHGVIASAGADCVLASDYDALLLKAAELELLADDACGKRCPDCGAPMVSLSTIDGGQRVCSGCNKTWDWHLKKGQQPLIGNNRMVNKV